MTSRSTAPTGAYETDPWMVLKFVGVVVSLVVAAPAVIIGALLSPLARRDMRMFAVMAVSGVAMVSLVGRDAAMFLNLAADQWQQHGGVMHTWPAVKAAWLPLAVVWLMTLPCCMLYALGFAALRPPTVEEQRSRAERKDERVRAKTERRAHRAAGTPPPRKPRGELSFEIGQHVGMDHVLPHRGDTVSVPVARLARTALCIGAPGSGKTETLRRLAYGVASETNWQVIMLDAKGEANTQLAFAGSMAHADRDTRLFPQGAYDGWRGSGREIANRLVALIDWADEGGGAYYRDLSTNLVRMACTAPAGSPRSSRELIERLDRNRLRMLWGGLPEVQEVERMRDEHIDACRQRYRSFFDAVHGQLDGDWAFEDVDCAYILLNELLYAEETSKLGRFLIEDFKQYVAGRNPTGRQVLFMIDEFSAIADGERTARMCEIVRSYGGATVLAPQSLDGMGGPEAAARILNAAHTIFLHAVPDPEEIVRAAGTKLTTEWSLQHERGRSTDVGSTRTQHEWRVDPNEVRRLTPGMCIAIGNGRGEKLLVKPAPQLKVPERYDRAAKRTKEPPPEPESDGPVRL